MALQTISAIADNFTTDAQFRTWGGGIAAKLAALGFVQTADTGQINWTTVTKPTVINTVAGYEIWRFADSLQSTAPIFFKVEYGTTTSSANGPQLWVSVGTATDGAGVITSSATFSPLVTTTTRQGIISVTGTAPSGVTGNEYLWAESSGGGALGVLLWPSIAETSLGGAFFGIERFRNLDGTASGDGFVFYNAQGTGSSNGGGVAKSQPVYLTAGSVEPGQSSFWLGPAPSLAPTSNIIGTTLYPLPVFTGWPTPRLYGPSQMLLVYPRADMAPAGNTFALSHYGVSRTWLTAGMPNAGSTGWGPLCGPSVAGWSFAMRGD